MSNLLSSYSLVELCGNVDDVGVNQGGACDCKLCAAKVREVWINSKNQNR